MESLTLESFEQASEIVKKVTLPTKLVYSEYLSKETGGKIYNRTKGTEFQGQPFPEFMQKLIAAGGLVKYTNSKKK